MVPLPLGFWQTRHSSWNIFGHTSHCSVHVHVCNGIPAAAYKINSEESIIAEHLGDAYYKFQLTEKAKQMYTRAAKVETDEEKSNQILKKLSEISNPLQSEPKRLPASNNQK